MNAARCTTLLSILAVTFSTSAQADDDSDVGTRAPRGGVRVLEAARLDLTAAPTGIALWVGAHGWLDGRYHAAVRAGFKRPVYHADLDGDGNDDFDVVSHAHGWIEGQVDLGYPIYEAERTHYQRGGIVRRTRIDGEWVSDRRTVGPGKLERESVAVVSGTRLAIASGSPQLAIPLGVRWDRRRLAAQPDYTESWAQLRGLLFAPSGVVGLDAEVAWLPASGAGLGLFFEYIPAQHDADPAGYTCTTAPRECRPDHEMTAFDLVPLQGRATFGLRLHGEIVL